MKNLAFVLLSFILIFMSSCTTVGEDEIVSTIIEEKIKEVERLNKILTMTEDTAVIIFIKNYKIKEIEKAYSIQKFLKEKNNFLMPLTESRISAEKYINILEN
jgi:hypothetical protein